MAYFSLGLELSVDCLKLVCLQKVDGKFRLFRLDQFEVPKNAHGLSDLLLAWQKERLPQKAKVEAVLSLSESLIFFKEMHLPKTNDKELNEAVFWEISSVASLPRSEVIWQWQQVGTSKEKEGVNLSAALVKKATVEPLVEAIQKSGVRLLAVEPSSLSFARINASQLRQTTLLIIAQNEETNFVIFKDSVPVFSNSVPVSLEGMKTKKQRLDRDVTTVLAANAKKVLGFWESRGGEKIKQVLVVGEGIRFSGLAKAVNSLVRLPANFAHLDRLKRISLEGYPQPTLDRYAIALGAAVRLISETERDVMNFLPEEEKGTLQKERRQLKVIKSLDLFSKMSFGLFLIQLVIFSGLVFYQRSIDRDLSQTQVFVSQHPAQKLIPQIQEANRMLQSVDFLTSRQVDLGEKVRKIAQLTPTGIQFKSLTANLTSSEEWKVAGIGSREEILAFYQKLKSSLGAKQVSMPYSNLQKETEADFKINILW